jgi:5-methylcytosine-specific restriction endonuclease McrA
MNSVLKKENKGTRRGNVPKEYYQKKRARIKEQIVEYKGGKCEICDYNKSLRALEFHHIDPSEKDFNIGGCIVFNDKLKREIDKCILVCSNCHCEIHDKIRTDG